MPWKTRSETSEQRPDILEKLKNGPLSEKEYDVFKERGQMEAGG